jgi:hypothetical protein
MVENYFILFRNSRKLLRPLAWCVVHRDAGGIWWVATRRCATHGDTGGRRDAARMVAATGHGTHRDTSERRDAVVSRRVAKVVPAGCRVGVGDGDTAYRC